MDFNNISTESSEDSDDNLSDAVCERPEAASSESDQSNNDLSDEYCDSDPEVLAA